MAAPLLAIAGGLKLIGGLFQAKGYFDQAQAERQKAAYNKVLFDFNRALADISAEDAIFRGKDQMAAYGKQGSQLIGAQRAALAAQGVDIDSGSAFEIQQDSRRKIREDLATIRMNAWREAMGYKAQALQLSLQGRAAAFGAEANARNYQNAGYVTLLGAAAGGAESVAPAIPKG